ncbi:MAG: protein kinase domain-containing protein, partial [Planctomycetota bacterium]
MADDVPPNSDPPPEPPAGEGLLGEEEVEGIQLEPGSGDTVFAFSATPPEEAKAPPPTREEGPPPTREEGPPSSTTYLRKAKGIRGDVSLTPEEGPSGSIAGPASEKRYAVLNEIARGGMGAIMRLVDKDIRRPVAMKVILNDESREMVERFVEEAQITGQLEHPNIVPVHELGLSEERAGSPRPYFTMKLVRGESLDPIIDRIADGDPQTVDRYPLAHLLNIFLKVCDAVAFAHSKGVVHRDLKPENVMVGRFGEVLVMDWGLAKVAGRDDVMQTELVASIRSERETGKTLTGDVMGTPSYMPPEQADGRVEEIDQRSDVFSLGGILYRILTHEAPYTGETVTRIMVKALKGEVVPPRRRSPMNRIAPELESICMKALAKEKKDRYRSVEALADDLRAFLDHRLVTCHRYGFMARLLRFLQRHPAGSLAGGVAALLLTLGAGAGMSLVAWGREQAARAAEEKAHAEVQAAHAREQEALAEAESLRAERMEKRAVTAEELLQKGRKASYLLRIAHSKFGNLFRDLKGIVYSSDPPEHREKQFKIFWNELEGFRREVQGDSASQATWQAILGWFRMLCGEEDTAVAHFQEARRLDPDVPYGPLFEAMHWLKRYFQAFPVPTVHAGNSGVEFGMIPAESPLAKEAREAFLNRVEDLQKARVWGGESSADFLKILEGLEMLHQGDFEATERGLTLAIAMRELAFIEEELLFARARVRFLRKDFDGGLDDIHILLNVYPKSTSGWLYAGDMMVGKGCVAQTEGRNGREAFRQAVTHYGKALEVQPTLAAARINRGAALLNLGRAQSGIGEDPRESFARAIQDADEVIREDPRNTTALYNRGSTYINLGMAEILRGIDPEKTLRKAIDDFEEMVRWKPD